VTFEKTRGLIAAPLTPMRADGDVDVGRIEAQAEFLARNGVVGAFACGTTGEGPSLTVPERMDVVRRWTEVAPDGFRVIVNVGHISLRDCRAMASHAAEVGAWGIGSTPSLFYRPTSLDALVDFAARIAAAAGSLPFYYYHVPSMTGVNFPMVEFLRAAAPKIPNLAGVKYTYEDLMDYSLCRRLDGGRFDCLFGRDEILLAGLSLGAEGAIGSTYNLAAPLYHGIMEACRAGDLDSAGDLQGRSMAMVCAVRRHGGEIPCFKHMMKMIGLDVGPPRPPLRPLTADQERALEAELEDIGFQEYCSK